MPTGSTYPSLNTDRRNFLKLSAQAAAALALEHNGFGQKSAAPRYEPFALGLLIKPFPDPDKKIAVVRQLGIPRSHFPFGRTGIR